MNLKLAMLLLSVIGFAASAADKNTEPKVVNPGPPPADAIVLFDGKDLSRWKAENGGEAKWKLVDGAMEVNGTGSLVSKEEFGDCQLHVGVGCSRGGQRRRPGPREQRRLSPGALRDSSAGFI